jgi:hypothetical protein
MPLILSFPTVNFTTAPDRFKRLFLCIYQIDIFGSAPYAPKTTNQKRREKKRKRNKEEIRSSIHVPKNGAMDLSQKHPKPYLFILGELG